jgi:hypothetical protein
MTSWHPLRMSQLHKVALFLCVFFLGCAAEHLLVVPPARAGTSPTRWEYACKIWDYDGVTTKANLFGAEGWELVTVAALPYQETWCFKRPLP